MSSKVGSARPGQGAGFIYQPVLSTEIVTPEQFSEEQLRFAETAGDFFRSAVEPRVEELDHKAEGVLLELMHKAADLGLFMITVPERYGGLGLDKTASLLVSEAIAGVGSFATSIGAQTGIGTLPLVYYGTEEQKQRYLPRLATGELIAAYALSEPGSGSDALAARATARLSPDGKHYVLSGTKQWITNAAIADLFTVFAQVDGKKFSAFLVERGMPGVSIGREEHKLGIRGSSTCQLILEDVPVPVENLLGEVGRGHKIAFNILNLGRLTLGAGSLGAAKYILGYGVRYAKERKQFGQPLAAFGLIRDKIATAAMLCYACESMIYRTAGLIDAGIADLPPDVANPSLQAASVIEQFTIEASLLKVLGSEALYRIADEVVQIYGGNGYVEDYPAERVLRDARVHRIFEGTNEINRLLIPTMLLRRALAGQLPLLDFAGQVQAELANPSRLPAQKEGPLAQEIRATELAKRAVVLAATFAAQKYRADIEHQQEILAAIADSVTDLYSMDSVVCRAYQAREELGEKRAEAHLDLAQLCCFESRLALFNRLRRLTLAMPQGRDVEALERGLGRLDVPYRLEVLPVRERIVNRVLEHDGYVL